ncbi:MAG: hypothetical protein ABSA76_09630 [Bacteroidales bacterium]
MENEVNASKSGQSSSSEKFGTGRIIIKFSGDLKMPYDEKIAEFLEKTDFKPWISLKKEYPGIEVHPFFTRSEQESLKILVKRAEKLNPRYKDPDFFSYFRVTVPKDTDTPVIQKLLKSWKELKSAYIEPVTVRSNPLSSYDSNGRAVDQKYLDAAPTGISAKNVWSPSTVAGSDGAGIKFIDLETGWNLNHEDIAAHAVSLLGTNATPSGRPHGTSVLGIVCACDNSTGCIGVAPNPASVKVISPTDTSVAGAIGTAAANLGYGDVLLIEIQALDSNIGMYVPVEIDSTVAGVIQTATSAGIIVIEPGGDGDLSSSAINFKTYQDPDGLDIFNPSSLNYFDSGAIIVSASKWAVSTLVPGTHEKAAWAPFGARVDCYAWGENINTLDSDTDGLVNDIYTTAFGYTSGSAAIIAGAVLSIQGMAKAFSHCRIGPSAMRTLLRNSVYGTDLLATGTSIRLSVFMPDLSLINSGYISALPVFSVTMSETDPSTIGGSDGTATATPVNGQAPFTYLWNDPLAQTGQTATALLAGTYTVTVTDKHGCIIMGTIAVGGISATVAKTDVTCNGASNGTITITVTSGGTSPFFYSIDDGSTWTTIPAATETFSGLGPASYTVKVKDSSGLTKPLGTVTITEPAVLSATVTSLNSTAAGLHNGEIHITSPTGGSGSYIYAIHTGGPWQASGDFPNLGPGTYNVQIGDAVNPGCTLVLNGALVITEPSSVITVTATVTDIIKFGDHTGKIVLTASGGTPPYSYDWGSGVTTASTKSNLAAGPYAVTVTDSAANSVVINVTVKYIYAEIVRNVHHGILIRLLKLAGWSFTGYRTYKIMWKGYSPHPIIIQPCVDVHFNHVTAGPVLSETVGSVTWSYRMLKVPLSNEGDILVLPSVSGFPFLPHSFTIPVKLIYLRQTHIPIIRPDQILVADFKMIITNNNVDYSL